MIKRYAVIGIGFALLVIGLACLALLPTGVIYLRASKDQRSLFEVKPPNLTPEGPGRQAGLERRQLPEPLESMQQTSGPGSQTAQVQVPAPQSSEGPRTPSSPANTAVASGEITPGSAERGVGEQPLPSSPLATEKPIAVPQPGKGEHLYSRQDKPGQTGTPTRGARTTGNPSVAGVREARSHPSSEALRPVVIRFHFDPAAKREIDVARVHFGDSISVKVRRFGQEDIRLHLVFAVPNTVDTDVWRGWSVGSRRAVVVQIQGMDRISLTADRDFGVVLTRELDSKKGAVLKLGADCPPGWRSLVYPHERGAYEIEMKIYPGNRWNIKPRAIERY